MFEKFKTVDQSVSIRYTSIDVMRNAYAHFIINERDESIPFNVENDARLSTFSIISKIPESLILECIQLGFLDKSVGGYLLTKDGMDWCEDNLKSEIIYN